LGAYNFELVVHDEVENFRDYDHDLFDYPYEDRRTKLPSFNLGMRDFKMNDPIDYTLGFTKADYEYTS
jgi:hypothetical protein